MFSDSWERSVIFRIASFLSILGLPIDLMGPISGFYRLLDMAFTTINVEGDVAANLIISKSTKGLGVSYMEGVAKWHHGVPKEPEYEEAVKEIEQRIEAVSK